MRSAKKVLSAALALLFLGGVCAIVVIVRLHSSQTWVTHTYRVELAVGDLSSALAELGRQRVAFVESGDESTLVHLAASRERVTQELAQVRQLVSDNPTQLSVCDRLDANAARRVALTLQAIQLKRDGQGSPERQMDITSQVARVAVEGEILSSEMRHNEDRLLERRTVVSETLFIAMICVLAGLFIAAVAMFWIYHSLLRREIREREAAEHRLRKLSGDLMRAQDDERRKLARELHDDLGQTLIAVQMTSESLQTTYPKEPLLRELGALCDQSVSQIRTVSHLLHPPLLDEIGLVSAIKWLVTECEKRAGIKILLQVPDTSSRLPRLVELAIFRVCQEALTNIVKHARCDKAEISLDIGPAEVVLLIQDYGKGAVARPNGNEQSGIGLMSMRERIRDLGGTLQMESDAQGTRLLARIPVSHDGEPVEVPVKQTEKPTFQP